MTSRMFKYPIHTTDVVSVPMSPDAVVRHVGMQGGTICLWAETNDVAPVRREFKVIGTGHTVPADSTYLGTVFDGPFVWHVYESGTPAQGDEHHDQTDQHHGHP